MKIVCDSYCTAQVLPITFDTKIYLRKYILLIYRRKMIYLSQGKLLQ